MEEEGLSWWVRDSDDVGFVELHVFIVFELL
jgi:hypothetical protein